MENLTPRAIFNYVDTLSDENRKLTEEVNRLRETCVLAEKFYNVALTTKEVANMHGVTDALVRKYITIGSIPRHPMSTDAKILVRASDALLLNFKELKQQAKYL